MTLTYNVEGTPLEKPVMQRKFVADLRKMGMALNCKYAYGDALKAEKYGFTQTTKGNDNFSLMVNGQEIHTTWSERQIEKMVEKLEEALPDDVDVALEQTESEKLVKQWAKIMGEHMYFDRNVDIVGTEYIGEHTSEDTVKRLYYSDRTVSMAVTLRFRFDRLVLKFNINWEAGKIQKKQDIEAKVVDLPLSDMGHIQKIVERIASYKKNGVDVDNPEIECHFDAKTESRSECAPDIIAKVREARKSS